MKFTPKTQPQNDHCFDMTVGGDKAIIVFTNGIRWTTPDGVLDVNWRDLDAIVTANLKAVPAPPKKAEPVRRGSYNTRELTVAVARGMRITRDHVVNLVRQYHKETGVDLTAPRDNKRNNRYKHLISGAQVKLQKYRKEKLLVRDAAASVRAKQVKMWEKSPVVGKRPQNVTTVIAQAGA